MELKVRYDDGPWNFGVSIHQFRGDRIARETIYFAEPFDAPEWRALAGCTLDLARAGRVASRALAPPS